MPVVTYQSEFTGETNAIPRVTRLYAPDSTLAEIRTPGFLNPYIKSQGYSVLPTDFIVICAADGITAYKAVFTGEICTLTVLP